jgi:hypothetical protein
MLQQRFLPNAVIADYGSISAPDWYEKVTERVVAQTDGGKLIAVLHSRRWWLCTCSEIRFIFVDAVLTRTPG